MTRIYITFVRRGEVGDAVPTDFPDRPAAQKMIDLAVNAGAHVAIWINGKLKEYK